MRRYVQFVYNIQFEQLAIKLTLYALMILSSGFRERSGSVVECLTRDRGAVGSSLTGVTALWTLSKTHLS